MKPNPLAKHYVQLTPEERFRLIIAASGRGDERECGRLLESSRRISLSISDHAPYSQAFDELAWITFIELSDHAARLNDVFQRMDNAYWLFDDGESDKNDVADEQTAEGDRSPIERYHDVAAACGYVLKTKFAAWKLFCERLNIPPLLLWEDLPGFERLQWMLELAEKCAFGADEWLVWLNAVAPDDASKFAAPPITVAGSAAGLENLFRQRVRWWGG